jgi:hypothetical protein
MGLRDQMRKGSTELVLLALLRVLFFEQIRQGRGLGEKMRAVLISSVIFFALYGGVMGSTHSLW